MNLAIKRAGLAVLTTGVLFGAGAAPAQAGGPFTLTGDETATWSGGGTGAYLAYPALACDGLTPLDACDATLVTVNPTNADQGPASLTLTMAPGELDDFDLFVYRDADGDGEPEGDSIDDGREQTGLGAGEAESIVIPNATGKYLVEVVNFLSLEGVFDATATLDSPADPVAARAARSAEAAERQAAEAALAKALAVARR